MMSPHDDDVMKDQMILLMVQVMSGEQLNQRRSMMFSHVLMDGVEEWMRVSGVDDAATDLMVDDDLSPDGDRILT